MNLPLDQLLVNLASAEESNEPSVAKLLVDQVRTRIDEIKEYTDKLYAENKRLSEYRGEFQKSAAACKNEADRIYDRVKWCMEQAGFTDLPGKRWRVHIQNSAKDLKFSRPPDVEIYRLYPGLVNREVTYSWDEEKIRLLLEAGETFEYGQLVDNRYAKFYVKKEV